MKTIEGSARGRGGRGGRGRGRGGPPSSDPRFTHRRTDPKFAKVAQEQATGVPSTSDNRFKSQMRSDSRFHGAAVDAHGRPKQQASEASEELEDEEEEDDFEEEEEEEDEEEEELPEDEVDALDEDAANWSGSEVEETAATNRLAVVNCDWDHIRPEDIFAVLSHSLPMGGRLLSVELYLSNFGQEQLEYEREHGPNLWAKRGDADFDSAKDDNKKLLEQRRGMANAYLEEFGEEGLDDVDDMWEDDNVGMLDDTDRQEDDGQEENQAPGGERFSSGRYRQYEMNRMKYYYCVCTFDTIASAVSVYATCDGVDVEASGIALDLRYIPEEEDFAENQPNKMRTVTKIPQDFRPTQGFKNAALTQTRFQIGWDQEDYSRRTRLQDAMSANAKDDGDDLAIYIASSESDSDDDGGRALTTGKKQKLGKSDQKKQIRQRYAALLKGVVDIDPDKVVDEEAVDDVDEEDEVDSDSADDDDLNQFEDLEFDEEEEEEEEEDEEMPEGWSDGEEDPSGNRSGNMSTTIDFDEDAKASKIQRAILKKQELQRADLGVQDSLKHKAKRKEGKGEKKKFLKEQREAELMKERENKEEEASKLKKVLGDVAVDDDGPKLSGRAKQKQLGKAVKQRAAEEREQIKRQRILAQHGVKNAPKSTPQPRSQKGGSPAVDERFKSRLVEDPRFHMDLSTRGKGGGKVDKELTELASAVSSARRVGSSGQSHNPTSQRQKRNRGGADDALSFFESKK